MIPVAQLIVNISGTIAQSNQTHLIINTSNDWSPVNIATILVGIGSVLGIIAALVISRRGLIIQETASRNERLIEIYKLTNNPHHREARRNLYKAFRIYKKEHYVNGENKTGKKYKAENLPELKDMVFDNIFSDPIVLNKLNLKEPQNIRRDVELVRATLDNIGALLDTKLVPEDTILKAMWGVVINCWDCLEHHINIERDVRRTLDYMNNFETFYKKIDDYVKNHDMTRVRLEDSDEELVWK